MRKARSLLRGCRAQEPGRAARGVRAHKHATHIQLTSHAFAHRALHCTVARCGAAPTSSSPQHGDPFGLAALCGERQTRAGRAHATRTSPRPRPSAKPQAPGSAPLPSSRTAARKAPDVSSTLNWSGAFDSSPPTPPPLQRCRFRPRRARAPAPHRRRRRRRSAAAVAAAAQPATAAPVAVTTHQTPRSSATVEMARLVWHSTYRVKSSFGPFALLCIMRVLR